jgi:HlyD family secretion protein
MIRWLKRLAVVAVLVGAGWALRLTVLRPEPVEVTAHPVELGRVEETVTNSRAGTVRTRRRAELSPALPGRVAGLPVREGDRVVLGRPVLVLDDAEHRAQVALQERAVESARAARREACARAEQAARDAARASRLHDEGIISVDALEQRSSAETVARAACEAASAEVRRAEAGLEVARVSLDRTVLRAPFDGVVAQVHAEVGEWISPSPPGITLAPVLDIIDPDAIYVSAPLDEVDVGRVHAGQPVRVTLDPYPDRSFPGTVSRVAPYVDDVKEQSRTFEVEVELEDRELARTLRPGTTADVEVLLRAKEGVLRIPSYALVEGTRVLVVRRGALVSVAVETGLRNWDWTEVTSGLAVGEQVVTSLDREEVRAGARATIADSAAP